MSTAVFFNQDHFAISFSVDNELLNEQLGETVSVIELFLVDAENNCLGNFTISNNAKNDVAKLPETSLYAEFPSDGVPEAGSQSQLKRVKVEHNSWSGTAHSISTNSRKKSTKSNASVSSNSKSKAAVTKPTRAPSSIVSADSVAAVMQNPISGKFHCSLCTQSFTQRAPCVRHIASIHGEKKFTCEACGAEFGRKDKFKDHLVKKHQMTDSFAKAIVGSQQ